MTCETAHCPVQGGHLPATAAAAAFRGHLHGLPWNGQLQCHDGQLTLLVIEQHGKIETINVHVGQWLELRRAKLMDID